MSGPMNVAKPRAPERSNERLSCTSTFASGPRSAVKRRAAQRRRASERRVERGDILERRVRAEPKVRLRATS